MMPREIHQRLIVSFFVAVVMPLQFDIDVLSAEQIEDLGIRSRCQAHQAVGELSELFVRCCAFAFLSAHFHPGDQAAEILIAFSVFG
jgi:hypothetical protein